MPTKFVPKGPKRYAHQLRGLKKLIATGGVAALLFDPGTGKTMTALDYMSLLALKAEPDEAGLREVRVLVVAPLAAVDTWVDQAERYVTDDVTLWAEALGGTTSIRQRAEVIAARGGRPFNKTIEFNNLVISTRKRKPDWTPKQVQDYVLARIAKRHGPRGIHWEKSVMLRTRGDLPGGRASDGPDMLGTARPRLIIEVVNLDTFSSRLQVGKTTATLADVTYDAVKRFNPDLVVVDESHKIKSATSNVSRMLARIGRLVKRRVILTGTVMPAGPLDVYGQWHFMEPYAFGETSADGVKDTATFASFRNRFAEIGGWGGNSVIGYKNLDELQNIMAINSEVAKKRDALDLPPVMPHAILRTDLGPAETKAYLEMKKGLATKLATGAHATGQNRLAQMMKLRQITSGHIPDDNRQIHVLGDSKTKLIRSVVYDTLPGENRVVVFALFLYEIEMLRKQLIANARNGEPPTELMVISGATDPAERIRLRKIFGDTTNYPQRIVMIAQVQTMSLAVNELVTACNAIYGSLPTKRDDFVQSMDRLDRIGQERSVTFWFALAPGSIDEVIYNAHLTRTNLETAVLRHIFDGNVPAELLKDSEVSEMQAARRDEPEQETQVGRLADDGTGKLERVYGSRTEVVDPESPEAIAAKKIFDQADASAQSAAARAAANAAW
jgi:SNF2 family DNA or RNA helicase